MSALRAAARCKPVLLIKVGKHPAGEKAALSHTGALVGADDVFDAALRRAGVVRLANVGQMYAAASPCSRISARAASAWRSSPTAAAPA
jgi:acetyltransferase